ncbi:MAG: FkbM family methyltransferase [Caulobacteraceae bacterium]|nr:FkbM family methyltransferase [Caulobacteraceae bacterium]
MALQNLVRRSVPFLVQRASPQNVSAISKYMYIASLLDRFQVELVFDVGANTGQFVTSIREIGYRGQIISFEPVREQFEILQAKAKGDAAWRVENFALGAVEQSRDINLTALTVFASFREPVNDETPQFTGKNEVVGAETVEIRRLDKYIEANGLAERMRRAFIKTDTQGFDKDVLEGAGRYLESTAMVMAELSCIPIYKDMPDLIGMLEFFQGKDFKPVAFFPNNHRAADMAAVEFDYLGVNGRFH